MLVKTLPTAKTRLSRTLCHCCRKPIISGQEWDNETLHGQPCCSADCRVTVDNNILLDPPELVAELIGSDA